MDPNGGYSTPLHLSTPSTGSPPPLRAVAALGRSARRSPRARRRPGDGAPRPAEAGALRRKHDMRIHEGSFPLLLAASSDAPSITTIVANSHVRRFLFLVVMPLLLVAKHLLLVAMHLATSSFLLDTPLPLFVKERSLPFGAPSTSMCCARQSLGIFIPVSFAPQSSPKEVEQTQCCA